MKHIIILFVLVLSVLFIGCPTKSNLQPTQTYDISTSEGLFQDAQHYLKLKKYDFALRSFTTLVEDFSEDSLAADAQFMIGEILSNPKNPNKDLSSAIDEYQNLIDNYPDSKYVDLANQKIAKLEKEVEK